MRPNKSFDTDAHRQRVARRACHRARAGGLPVRAGQLGRWNAPRSARSLLKWYIIYTMNFEFDLDKSAANLKKHGIDFVGAQRLWEDPDLLEIPARTDDEPRFVVIGRIDSKHWSAVITYRDDRIRLISVRRSRAEEVALYEG